MICGWRGNLKFMQCSGALAIIYMRCINRCASVRLAHDKLLGQCVFVGLLPTARIVRALDQTKPVQSLLISIRRINSKG